MDGKQRQWKSSIRPFVRHTQGIIHNSIFLTEQNTLEVGMSHILHWFLERNCSFITFQQEYAVWILYPCLGRFRSGVIIVQYQPLGTNDFFIKHGIIITSSMFCNVGGKVLSFHASHALRGDFRQVLIYIQKSLWSKIIQLRTRF